MKKFIFLFALGAFASLSMAPTNFWPALFLGLSVLYICVSRTPKTLGAALHGFAFSLGYFGFSLSWIGNALLVEDNPYWWAWPLAISGLPLILSLFTFVFCTIHKKICKQRNDIFTLISFTIALFLTDYARGHLFTGFPWNLYAYTWITAPPIAQIAGIWNIYLLNGLTIFWALCPAFILCNKNKTPERIFFICLTITSFIAAYTYGTNQINYAKEPDGEQFEITIAQPNIKQSEKWKPENRANNFISLLELSKYNQKTNAKVKAHYIIWPETAISQDLINSPWVIEYISKMLSEYPNPAYLITGALRRKNNNYFNSIIVLNNQGETINTYDKSHLVPFGEYMPLSNIFDIAPIVGFTGFQKGTPNITLDMPEGIKITPLICYEIIFPDKITASDLIINTTNDAWYGDSAGPYQHMVQTQFRAIEANTPIARAANTGISGFITRNGNLIKKSTINSKNKNIHIFTQKAPTSIK